MSYAGDTQSGRIGPIRSREEARGTLPGPYKSHERKPLAHNGFWANLPFTSAMDRVGETMEKGLEIVPSIFGAAIQGDVDSRLADISSEAARTRATAEAALTHAMSAQNSLQAITDAHVAAGKAETLASMENFQSKWNHHANEVLSKVNDTLSKLQLECTQHGSSIELLNAQLFTQRGGVWHSRVSDLEQLAQAHNARLDACDACSEQLVQLQAKVNANHSKSQEDFDALHALCEELTAQMSQNRQELLVENATLGELWREHETKMLADTKARDELYRTALILNETQRNQNAAILEKTKVDIINEYKRELTREKDDFEHQLKTQKEEYTRQTTRLEEEIKGLRDQYRRNHAEAGALHGFSAMSLKENPRRANSLR